MAQSFPKDRFDVVPDDLERVGAHRAPKRRGRGWIWLAWCVLATVVLVAAGVIALFSVNGNLEGKLPFGDSPSATPTATSTPTPTIVPTVNPSLNVTVLNGTQTAGLAGSVTDKLTAAGWQNVTAANASETDLTKTYVYYSAPENQAAALGLAQSIPGATVQQSDAYVETGADLTVVLGSDYAATQ
jgi:hypothetical protein